MISRILKDSDMIYEPETGASLVDVLYNKQGDFVGIDYEKFFAKIHFKTDKDIHVNPVFHKYLNEAFEKHGLTDQKDFKKTVCAFKKVIEGCYLECRARDDVYDSCKFRVSIRKSKDSSEWKVSPNTNYLNFCCTCGVSPSLLANEDELESQKTKIFASGNDKIPTHPKEPVNYYKSLQKFSMEKPGTLSFGVLRQIISEELTKQMHVSKSFKVQVRRTGGSKLSDYAFVECFSSDNKNKNCKFKVSIKRNKSTNIWTLDETSTRKVYDCLCENNKDVNDKEGNVLKSGAISLEGDGTSHADHNAANSLQSASKESAQDSSSYLVDSNSATDDKQNTKITEDAISALTSEIDHAKDSENKNGKLTSAEFIPDASVENFLEAAIGVVQDKEAEEERNKAQSHSDNVFEEKTLEELEKAETLDENNIFSKSKKRPHDSGENEATKKQKVSGDIKEDFDYYKSFHNIEFFTKDAVNKTELSEAFHEELKKHGINRQFECSLKAKTKDFTNGLYVLCPNQCGFKAVFRRNKNGPWSLYSKSKIGNYTCNCFSHSGETLKDGDDKVPVIGEDSGLIAYDQLKDTSEINKPLEIENI